MIYSTPPSKKLKTTSPFLAGVVGTIAPPPGITKYITPTKGQGLFTFFSNLIKFAAVIAGLALIVQIIMAGYGFIAANGDAKKMEAAWAKIWQSLLGLLVIASSFALAGLAERLTGINIINPDIYGP